MIESRYHFSNGSTTALGGGRAYNLRRQSEEEVDEIEEAEYLAFVFAPPNNDDLREIYLVLWNNLIQNLHRLSSLQNASRWFLPLREAAIEDGRLYLVVKNTSQLVQFSSLETTFLSNRHKRQRLWSGLTRLAEALDQMHLQGLVHGAFSAQAVYWDGSDPETFRLGDLNLGTKLGLSIYQDDDASLRHDLRSDFSNDWAQFCSFVAGLFPIHLRSKLTKAEEQLLKEFGNPVRLARPLFSQLVLANLHQAYAVSQIAQNGSRSKRLLLVLGDVDNERMTEFANELREYGFQPGESDFDPYDPTKKLHIERLQDFLISLPTVSRSICICRDQKSKISINFNRLNGNSISLSVAPFQWRDYASGDKRETWLALLIRGRHKNPDFDRMIDLSDFSIEVALRKQALAAVLDGNKHLSWQTVLHEELHLEEQKDLRHYEDFLRLSNLIELIRLDAQIFPVKRESLEGAAEDEVWIQFNGELKRDSSKFWVKLGNQAGSNDDDEAKLISEYLRFCEQLQTSSDEIVTLMLSPSDDLKLSPSRRSHDIEMDSGRPDPYKSYKWDVDQQNSDFVRGLLRIVPRDKNQKIPAVWRGYARKFDHWAQLEAISRRTNAIRNVNRSAYLLQTLASPSQTFMNTQSHADDIRPDLGKYLLNRKVDSPKQSAIRNILQVRPMYLVQGPPGTGKTHLLSVLLGWILSEDPVAKILIAAKDHTAVDNIMEEMAANVDLRKRQILMLRYASGERATSAQEEGLGHAAVSKRFLGEVLNKLRCATESSLSTNLWQEFVEASLARDSKASASVLQIVQDAASIVFSTSASKELAKQSQAGSRFDWVLIEEAGIAYAHELVPALQLGFRWVLIGDQNQLEPYMVLEFTRAIANLDALRSVLRSIKKRSPTHGEFFDDRTNQLLEQGKNVGFSEYFTPWLKFFNKLFEQEVNADRDDEDFRRATLNVQYRMPRSLADLVGDTFYANLKNKLTTARPDRQIDLMKPAWLREVTDVGARVVWIDVPYRANPDCSERERSLEGNLFQNHWEAKAIASILREAKRDVPKGTENQSDVLVLVPYQKQKQLILATLEAEASPLSEGLIYYRPTFGLSAEIRGSAPNVYTIKSIIGAEADIVILSMTRTFLQSSATALERLRFIAQRGDLNVAISRAKTLLIIVGDWHFYKRATEHRREAGGDFSALNDLIQEFSKKLQNGGCVLLNANELGILQ